MSGTIRDTITLNNGVKMPKLGLGVWRAKDLNELIPAVKGAIDAGYRMIDTAAQYGNEEGVGLALRECGVPREELFITTKVLNADQRMGTEAILRGFEDSLRRLGLDYIDLYVLHWPINRDKKYLEAWRTLLKIYREGRARAIGVCNCHIHHLRDMIEDTGAVPMVDQMQCHPRLTQKPLLAFCQSRGIAMEAYSPLMRGNLEDVPALAFLAKKYGKTPAQIILRWDLQCGLAAIPKSVHISRIKENADLFDFSLTRREMFSIDRLNENHYYLPDPDTQNWD